MEDHPLKAGALALERRRDALTQLRRDAEAAAFEEARSFLQEQIDADELHASQREWIERGGSIGRD